MGRKNPSHLNFLKVQANLKQNCEEDRVADNSYSESVKSIQQTQYSKFFWKVIFDPITITVSLVKEY